MRVPTELLRETIIIEDFAGSGARGPQYATARSVRASVQSTSKLVSANTATNTRGQTVTVDALAVIRPEAGPVRPESRVTWGATVYRVVSSYAMPDSRRPSHYELELAR